jgi:uncharacterized ion transporter superfamily protein YfcC
MNLSHIRLPSAYTILFLLIILVTIGTWIIPAGLYDRDEASATIPWPLLLMLAVLIIVMLSLGAVV